MDSILSVRISDELKQKFMNIAQEQGINNKDLMEQVIKTYELENAKESYINVKNDIEELQSITGRIVDIYLNIIERNKVKNLELTNLMKDKTIQEEEKIVNIKKEKENVENKLKDIQKENSELKHEIKTIKEKFKETEDNSKEFKQLNNMLQEKNLQINDELLIYKVYKDKNILLEKEIKSLLKENQHLNDSVKELETNNKVLKKEVDFSKENFEAKLNVLHDSYKIQLKQQGEGLKIGFSKEIMQLEQNYIEKINTLRNEYEEKISKLTKEREEEAYKIRTFLLNNRSLGDI